MLELSLLSGAGGGLLATHHLLGFKTIGYVEYDDYCQKVIARRIKDGLLPEAPIYGDIRAFNGDGYARSYKGLVDVVTGGFPCQAWSTAASGKNNGLNLWPQMLRTVGEVCPEYIFSENVDEGAIIMAQKDLADCGYRTIRCKLSAKDMGADHIRERWWLFAHANDKGKFFGPVDAKMGELPEFCSSFWKAAPGEPGIFDGVASRVDRFRAIGNGQVPIVAAAAWKILTRSAGL